MAAVAACGPRVLAVAVRSPARAQLAAAGEIEVVAKDVKFPEGPLWADGALLFVEYGGHTILRLAATAR